jgi:hypothetical protein
MLYFVELTDKEKNILAGLINRHIEYIQDLSGSYSVSYGIRLNVEGSIIDFTPDEIATPEKDKPLTDVTRPLITDDQSELRSDLTWSTITEDVGIIRRIAILQTLVTFSPFLSPTDPKTNTVIYGTGEAWENVLHHPTDTILPNLSDDQAIIHLDIGVAIFTDKDLVITISTDGSSYYVNAHFANKIPDGLSAKIMLKFID